MKNMLIAALNQAAPNYNEAAVLPNEIAQRLSEHLDGIRLEPKIILDLGAKTGFATALLQARYPQAEIINLDIAELLLKQANNKNLICADIEALPFTNASFDLVFSNLSLFWFDFKKVFAEVRRVIKPNSLFIFSSLGPDSLHELKQSVNELDQTVPLHDFTDMHHLGDALLKAGFLDPVMEMDYLQLTFSIFSKLLTELKQLGLAYLAGEALLTPEKITLLLQAYAKYQLTNRDFPVTFEIIYGHAWANSQQETLAGETIIPLANFLKKPKPS